MIIITGGAGFIGSAFVWRLNKEAYTDIMVVDEKDAEGIKTNLANRRFNEYVEKGEFLNMALSGKMPGHIDAIIHMGACSSTTMQNAGYLKANNFEYTKALAHYCIEKKIPFIYASSAATYGDGGFGYSDEDANTRRLNPLNLYGHSKQDFDLWALDTGAVNTMTGLKYFNVFGPNEYHKGDMRSIIAKSYDYLIANRKMRLFKSYKPEYKDGEQKRDFIYIKDAVEATYFFLEHPDKTGIFNIGTGKARSWNALAKGMFAALSVTPVIEYMDMPPELRDKYQYFTEADTKKLRAAGYNRKFMSLEDATRDYCGYLKDKKCL
ncbi:MAG: ADP-glyceromanno-heptose 6-epimerase [Candidatus Raymondbacteria bacterium RifOxyA12_full_50_37]|uniref:ADP-L-glycero-D-manno-heptose-6-epimerase n=1 Tax=Candidatus Raymondbacteria bacterium RIFOXYD12_FULL_49_13 TaxID=1817890 RepID=A0A1F7F033_UNCRA|nr:MAG: ADP-glyceromanno-heptose 6-epimerase [Candidatus Raymondbacteria bacterium RifOxyA12_full_50_37]OGJ92993.1 MAG: ADP-glyceromanno-heptose 6-epimerase [Candidatus Raymondbacteria bacterium RIFOXYA2_FULL_49_16]OGJ95232.1 MAG: ADP-glyceromanno-heptose 6-epimerase [Candidatus Raymondbacteria bacterium RifOxyB12_full_50_8]OGJ97672.1 MAG: ADP-glyceromanno-heptose 6-epimerase [Candidatus Raymondbacteria bacterium RifOxyC12_full_50_8]OGJ99906.1 MAG: ADP-glyceromanno-heptose 6-epimerase [Candidat